MFRKKVRMLILSAAIAGTMVLPVSAAETTAPAENVSNEAANVSENDNIQTDVITSDDLTVSGEGEKGETGLPDKEHLADVEEENTGSISIGLTEGKAGTSVEGITFHCIKVADITGGEYVLTEAFADTKVNLNELKNADEASEAAKKLAQVEGAEGETGKTDAEGKLVFSNLGTGVYLLKAEDTETYDIITPALVAVPSWDEEAKGMAYELEVEPKHSEREVVPDEPGSPQTNVFSPVYLYFGGAAVLAVVAVGGNIIYKRRKNK